MFQVDVFIRDDRGVTFVYPFGAKHGSQFCSNHARAPTLMDTRNMDACAGNHPVRVASSTVGGQDGELQTRTRTKYRAQPYWEMYAKSLSSRNTLREIARSRKITSRDFLIFFLGNTCKKKLSEYLCE